jgi:2-methylisocitrate lyase-like PEP mutase family enzyme
MGVMSKKAREIFYRKGRPITHIASAPSVHDARMYERAGFEYIFLGGDATFGIMLGIPGTYLDITEKTFIAKYYVNAVNIPVLMDCDEVCGRGPAIVERAVEKYVDIGLAGMDIDDRVVFEVRGAARTEREHGISECVPTDQMADMIGAAKDVMKSLDPDFVLRVRCYDFHVGTPLEETIKRLQAYERAGADVLYLGGVETPEDTKKCLDGLNIPCTVPATWMTYDLARDLGLCEVRRPYELEMVMHSAGWEFLQDFNQRSFEASDARREQYKDSPYMAHYGALFPDRDVLGNPTGSGGGRPANQ